jgi:hypothetical protein
MPPSAACSIVGAVTARAVQQLEARLDELRRVGRARLATAFAAAVLAGPAHGLDPALGYGLAAGAFVVALLSVRAFADRSDLIETAVVDRDALAIPAVRDRAARIASPQELERAADTLRRLPDAENARPRVVACRVELLELADALSSAQPPQPAVAVECVRFVEGPGSPLYGPSATEGDLRAELRHLLVLVDAGKPQPSSAPPPIPFESGRGTLHST